MSTISAGTTTTTALVQTGDTTGALVLATGASATPALTLSSAQAATFAGTLATTSRGITAASMPAGSVLQVINTTSNASFSTSSGTFVDTGISASITPTSSTSKILVMVSVFSMVQFGNMAPAITMYRGSTNLDPGAFGFAQTYAQTGSTITTAAGSGFVLDSPATTASTAYKLYFRNQNANGSVGLNSTNGLISIVLMEIAA